MPGKGWSVSYSAPAFTPEEEQDEKDNLSPEEFQLIEDELHGKQVFDFDAFETPDQVSSFLDEFDRYIRNKLPPELTETYFEAMEKVPHLVQQETDPLMFLRAEFFDVENAARRLAMHWKERKSLFGDDRAFLPMTMAPDGALGCSEADMRELQLGFVCRVPDDEYGRPVIFLDRANSTKDPNYQRDCWLRVLWYMVQVVCLKPEYQKSGYVVIINLKDYEPHKCGDRLGAKKMFLYVRECWCPRFKGYHATYGSHQTPVKLVEPAIRKMQGRHIRLHLRNHYGYDSVNILAMNKFGLSAIHVSPAIGGKFSSSDHATWVEQQQQFEKKQGRQLEQ
mmetsp:Transcript_88760/g.247022  ORF Transcript_88760/g.247022 Transcript_88760/m.247022 type:complete len:336 (-) Transcript_88760:305-1312(-)